MNFLQQLTVESSFIPAVILVSLGGLLSGFSPCTLPTALLVVSFVGGSKENRSRSFYVTLAFVLGISLTLAFFGLAASLAGRLFLNSRIFNIIAAFIVLTMGLSLLGLFKFDIKLPRFFRPQKGGGSVKAFLLGIPFGLAASPCTAPLMITVLAYAASRGNPAFGFVLLFAYAFARSLPLLAIGSFSGILQRLQPLTGWSDRIEKISGMLLIGLGFYLLW